MTKQQIKSSTLAAAMTGLAVTSAQAVIIVGTEFTARTFSGNVVTVTDYTLNNVANPGLLTFNGPSAFMTSIDATGKAVPKRNAPNWDVLIPINVAGSNIDLSNISITFEAFSNSEASKTNISNGFSPNYQPTVRLLNGAQVIIDVQTLDAWADNGDNLVAGWTGDFDFVNNDTLQANTNYFIEIDMTGSGGNNVGINSLTLNGTVVPEPTTTALLGLGGLALMLRRRR